ncbi:GNAT family N-acetyltransferase [Abyssisolibacter fermentans]|uniref:GNAT family N-acetyltransferase n=1 Tax=Abyssisolibacter fermentans TaxID=1766203 RepID=UPI000837975B|nr:GNAT family N-acetyltransferase [Abyssisolibacter fermentans]
MKNKLKFEYVETIEDIDYFWKKRNEYMLEDIIPNIEYGASLTKEGIEWFFSDNYKNHIMNLYKRSIDPLYIIFFYQENINVGFVDFVIYNSEDGKCFILDYCIHKGYRNNGFGKEAFELLEQEIIRKGAVYINLNVSNHRNENFWKTNGFGKTEIKDDHENYIYRKQLKVLD